MLESAPVQGFSRVRAAKAGQRFWVIVLVALTTVYLLRLGPLQYEPAFGDAPSIYLVSAQSIAHGTGYRNINYPDAPASQLYPIGYPFVLSCILRAFQFGLTSICLARLLTVAATLLWLWAARELLLRVLHESSAICAVLAIGLSPPVLEMAGAIKADLLFGAIAMVAVILAMRETAGCTRNELLARGVMIGVLAACSLLIRTIGFTVIFGLFLGMLLHGRKSELRGFVGSLMFVLIPWVGWSFVHNGGTFHSYVAENAITWKTPAIHLWALGSRVAPTMLFAPFDLPTWRLIAGQWHLSAVQAALGILITVPVIVGWWKLVRRLHVAALVLGPYMLIVLLWWFEATRFVIPVFPLLVFCGAAGAKAILPKMSFTGRRLLVAAEVACVSGALFVGIGRLNHVWRSGNYSGPFAAQQWTDMDQGLRWIKGNTPENAVIFSSYPAGVWLFTSRLTLDLNDASHVGDVYTPSDSLDLAAAIQRNRKFTDLYVCICSRDDNTPAKGYIDQHPVEFDLQWSSKDGVVRLYKAMPTRVSAGAKAVEFQQSAVRGG
jgi:hypothetical protein